VFRLNHRWHPCRIADPEPLLGACPQVLEVDGVAKVHHDRCVGWCLWSSAREVVPDVAEVHREVKW